MLPKLLCLLDRNAVDCIKESNAGKVQTDPKKRALLQRLRALDRPGVWISPLLSIVEGEHGRPDTPEEKEACARKEADAVAVFFKYAVLEAKYLLSVAGEIGRTFAENKAAAWPVRERFLELALPLLANKVKQDVRPKLERQLLEKARELGVGPGDPALVLSLATLHGGSAARKVLHPHAINIYNSLNDIQVISLVGLIMALLKEIGASIPVKFATRDEGLDEILRGITHVDHTVERGNGEVKHQLSYPTAWFEDLSEEAALALLRRLASFQADESTPA